jgi:hypothetical protein
MTVSGQAGPLIVYGQNPATPGTGYQADYNGDNGPSGFSMGTMLLDPRYGYRAPLQAGTLAAVGIYETSDYITINAAPTVLNTANIASVAGVTSGTPLVLQATTANGIIVSPSLVTMPQSGKVFPVGALFIDSAPGMITYGQNGAIQCLDPRQSLARVLQITGSASATGGSFTIRGFDLYGFPMTETITATAGVGPTVGKKAWKNPVTITPGFTDAHAYTVGTTDIYGFPMAAYYFEEVSMVYNNAYITAATGFVAADATSPATATTGDVRGTYNIQSAANGVIRLQLANSPAAYNVALANGPASLFGVVNYAG